MHDDAPAGPREGRDKDHADLLALAVKRYAAAYERERDNITAALDDLTFLAAEDGAQWGAAIYADRIAKKRPALTINRLPQFLRQITGDIRQMKPAIKVSPVDDRASNLPVQGADITSVSDIFEGLIRHIEVGSDAQAAYFQAADAQVRCGIGAWRVVTEYAEETSFEQEIRIRGVDDPVNVLFDPDATMLTREDARYCFVPVDISRDAFDERFPDATSSGFGRSAEAEGDWQGWSSGDSVRVAEYWFREPMKRVLALLPEGGVDDLTDDEDAEAKAAAIVAAGGRVEEREGTRVMRALIAEGCVLEGPDPWPGRYIPIVPLVGEEIRVGRRLVRQGAIRNAKPAQQMYNYARSAEVETIALAPKAPFLGTETNFELYEAEWERANTDNKPFLVYTPDPLNGNRPPERVIPGGNAAGVGEAIERAAADMQAVIGIYDAGLGAKGNETSGRAITARQREGDTGSYVYIDNFGRAMRHTGRILVDLIPHVYDTARTVRVLGMDGKSQAIALNQPVLAANDNGDPVTQILNDVTVGAYEVVCEMGPSYATKREAAREGMMAFLQAAPAVAPAILDLVAKAQDWPLADQFGERLEALLPPPIKALLAAKAGEPPQPDPAMMAQEQQAQQMQQLEAAKLDLEHRRMAIDAAKIDAELQRAAADIEKARIDADARAVEAHHGARAAEAGAQAAAAPAQAGADPRVEHLADAVAELQAVLAQVVQAIQGAAGPPPEPGPAPEWGNPTDNTSPTAAPQGAVSV